MEQNLFLSTLFLVFGTIIFGAAIFNWKYFFQLRKAKILTNTIGITATRILYGFLGLLFAAVGANHLFNLNLFSF